MRPRVMTATAALLAAAACTGGGATDLGTDVRDAAETATTRPTALPETRPDSSTTSLPPAAAPSSPHFIGLMESVELADDSELGWVLLYGAGDYPVGPMTLALDDGTRVDVPAGVRPEDPGVYHCREFYEATWLAEESYPLHLRSCLVAGDLDRDGRVAWFALVPAEPDGSGYTLPRFVAVEDGLATLVNGWMLPIATTVRVRDCFDEGEHSQDPTEFIAEWETRGSEVGFVTEFDAANGLISGVACLGIEDVPPVPAPLSVWLGEIEAAEVEIDPADWHTVGPGTITASGVTYTVATDATLNAPCVPLVPGPFGRGPQPCYLAVNFDDDGNITALWQTEIRWRRGEQGRTIRSLRFRGRIIHATADMVSLADGPTLPVDEGVTLCGFEDTTVGDYQDLNAGYVLVVDLHTGSVTRIVCGFRA